jgi:hypothetical protein
MQLDLSHESKELFSTTSSWKPDGNPNELMYQLRCRAAFLACSVLNIQPGFYCESYFEKRRWSRSNMELIEKIDPDKYLMAGYVIQAKLGSHYLNFHAREGVSPTVAITKNPETNDALDPIWEQLAVRSVVERTFQYLVNELNVERKKLELVEMRVIQWDAPKNTDGASYGFQLACKISMTDQLFHFKTVGSVIYMLKELENQVECKSLDELAQMKEDSIKADKKQTNQWWITKQIKEWNPLQRRNKVVHAKIKN